MSGPDDGAALGLKHNQNLLVAHDSRWAAEFEAERTRLAAALGTTARAIEHYGSTAVAGLPAKPILDILIGVLPLSDWVKCHDPLLTLGYDYAEHAGVPGHHIFGRGRNHSERTHLVHVVEFSGESWASNLAFRDALRSDGQLRDRYLTLKTEAVATAPEGRAAYNAQKQAFIAAVKAGLAAR